MSFWLILTVPVVYFQPGGLTKGEKSLLLIFPTLFGNNSNSEKSEDELLVLRLWPAFAGWGLCSWTVAMCSYLGLGRILCNYL
jgi:hypothetical protein